MKQIIKGKKYDTETARKVGMASNGEGWRDFRYYEETLFCKRTGEYFLHGAGGPASRYAVSAGQNAWSGGEKLIPLTFENAKAWAEEHLTADEYESEFGEVTEDETSKVVTLSMPTNIIELARRRAQEAGMSLSAYIASLVQ